MTRLDRLNTIIELLHHAKASHLNHAPNHRTMLSARLPNIMYEELEDARILITDLMKDLDKQGDTI